MVIAQYIIVRVDMLEKHGFGLMAGQIAHASMAPISNKIRSNWDKPVSEVFDKVERRWIDGPFNKIILGASHAELSSLMEQLFSAGIKFVPIRESSLNAELTCIGLQPYDKGRIAPFVKHLELLK